MLSRGVCRNFCLLHSSQPDGPLPASLPPRAGLPAAHKATGSPGPSAFLERGLLPCPPSAGLGGSRSLDVSYTWLLTCILYHTPDQTSFLFLYCCLPSDTPNFSEARMQWYSQYLPSTSPFNFLQLKTAPLYPTTW